MGGTDLLGEFEQLVLLAILANPDEGYAIVLRKAIEEGTERSVSRGALYRTLDRLEGKGLVRWDLEESDETRGGHPRKRFHLTDGGLSALRRSRAVVRRMSLGLEDVLEGL